MLVNNYTRLLERIFTIGAIIFFTRAFEMESFFNASEGELAPISGYNLLGPIFSLLQHGTFLITVFLLLERWRYTMRVIFRNKFLWGLILVVLLSFLWSSSPDLTQKRSLAFLETCTFGVYFASRYTLKEQLRLLAWGFGIVSGFCLLYSLALPGRALEMGIHAGAWRGPFIQKNLFARLMVLATILFPLVTPENPRERKFLHIACCLSFGLVVMSTSKTALGLVILLLIMIPLYKTIRWQDRKVIPLMLIIGLIVTSVSIWVIGNFENIAMSAGRDPTLSGRTVIWSALMDKIQERPWFGYGYMGFWHGIYGESAYVGKVYGTTYIPPHSHNGFIELMLAFGIIGTIFFVLSFLSNLRRAIISARLTKSSEGLWPLIYLSFIVFYNQTEWTLVEHNSIFWMLYVSLSLSRFIQIEELQKNSQNLLPIKKACIK